MKYSYYCTNMTKYGHFIWYKLIQPWCCRTRPWLGIVAHRTTTHEIPSHPSHQRTFLLPHESHQNVLHLNGENPYVPAFDPWFLPSTRKCPFPTALKTPRICSILRHLLGPLKHDARERPKSKPGCALATPCKTWEPTQCKSQW